MNTCAHANIRERESWYIYKVEERCGRISYTARGDMSAKLKHDQKLHVSQKFGTGNITQNVQDNSCLQEPWSFC